MRMKWALLLVGISAVAAVIVGLFPAIPAAADDFTTTSVHIVKLAPDGITVLQETTITYQQMEATLPIQGDGSTHYWTQGPNFKPSEPWNPAETDNLKDKGALKGTDLKDLCELVGGMQDGDTVKVHASDNFGNDVFPYASVYNPDPHQGQMVVCWYNGAPGDGSPGYVPDYASGMLLAFFTTIPTGDKLVFGNQDMHDYLPESVWHYNSGYPSANGLYCKYVSDIIIYTSATPRWSLFMTGAVSQNVPQAEFENAEALNCHGTVTYTDDSGIWGGIPLWMLTAFVDDTTGLHGEGAYNDALAAAGYDVKVIGADGSCTFRSTDIARSNSYILANQLNGSPLPVDCYPLRLVGPGVAAEQEIGEICRIELYSIPAIPQWTLKLSGVSEMAIPQALFEYGVACHGPSGDPWTYTDASGTWSGMPLWYVCGWVDDDNEHGPNSFNDDLAATGYSLKVIGAGGSSTTIRSNDAAHNSHIILADQLNGQPLASGAYPLALVGSGVPSGKQIGGVVKVQLVFGQPWDPNGDHRCDMGDIMLFAKFWGETGDPGWISFDVNRDGVVNMGDASIVGRHWGETW